MLVHSGDDRLRDPAVVGNKFARQELLRQAGFPVPPLCCVPVDVFDALARDLLAPPPAGPDTEQRLSEWAAAAAGRLAAADLPPGLAGELRAAAAALAGADGLLAVRACVVADAGGAGEDGPSDAFAGITESFLYVAAHEVPDRVRVCWASGVAPRSVQYRALRGLPPSSARVAVGIQRMVPGDRSFVAFSRDPRTGATGCVVAAAHGIGEGVVQERADVDHFFLDPTGEVRSELVVKQRMVGRPGTAGPPVARPVPPELAEPPVLTEDEVRQIGVLAGKVEAFFGLPQDIEGTITPDGAIHLLQARPVVFAPAVPAGVAHAAEPGTAESGIPWSNHNLTESFPGVSRASTFSVAQVFYRSVFADAYRRLGVPARRLRANEHHLQRMVGLLDGRAYYRLDAWFALHGLVPGFPLARPWWEKAMGLPEPHQGPTRRELWRALRSLPASTARLARLPGQVRRFLRWWDALVDGHENMDRWPAEQLVGCYRSLWTEVGRRWGVTLVNSFYLLACATAVSALVRRWVTRDAGEAQRILAGLLAGGAENRSVRGVRSAIALAERCRADPQLADRIARVAAPGGPPGRTDGDPAPADPAGSQDRADFADQLGTADRTAASGVESATEIWQDLVGGRYGAKVATAAYEHLRRYGDRAPHDLKLEEPSPRQQPGMVVAMIQPMVRGGLTEAGSRAAEAATRAEAEQELRRCCRGPRRLLIRGLAAGLRWFVKTREDTRVCRSQLYGLTREVLWQLGDQLARAGRLDQRADVFDLTAEEVLGAFDGTLVDTDLRGLARRRAGQRRAAAARPGFESALTTPHGVPVPAMPATPNPPTARAASGQVELRGLASSRGVVLGLARVVLDPSVAPESCRDRIIVAKETDPGWLFLMMVARGMVVERGTLLSHTAITGRLLGIPTVVAVAGATSLIADGTPVELDGAAGTVRILPG